MLQGEENAEQGSASGSRISVSEVGGKSASHGNGSGGCATDLYGTRQYNAWFTVYIQQSI